jgi:putative glycerol-1-phosphate prenyltransferase
MKLYDLFTKPGKKIAVLVDPDKPTDEQIIQIAKRSQESGVDFFFVGGSLLTNDNLDSCIKLLKIHAKIPVILFPGNTNQLSNKADGFLFLSLISGRNAEMLIGRHVIAAPYLKLSGLEILPTGYMLIDSGKPTSVSYMSNTVPIPNDKFDIAICTAMAGKMLGMKLIFLEGGSGAERSVSDEMIKMVHGSINIPLIVGGGIRTPERAAQCARAGADVIVIGNALEKEPGLLSQFADAVHGVI